MKVLHVAYSFFESSAGHRIAMSCNNVEHYYFLGRFPKSKLIKSMVIHKYLGLSLGIFKHLFNVFLKLVFIKNKETFFSIDLMPSISGAVVNWVIKRNKIDVLHLHWGGYGFFSTRSLKYINIPVIITAHDYQYFVSGCHVPMECQQYLKCSQCPKIKDNNFIKKIYKKIAYGEKNVLISSLSNLTVVAPSNYTKFKIKQKFPDLNITVIPNPLNSVYSDYPNVKFLPSKKIKILVVGINKNLNDNKGYDVIKELMFTMNRLNLKNIEFIFVASKGFENSSFSSISYGFLEDLELKKLYFESDLCVVPSKYETFSQVTLESISMCTPVIAFDKTGPKDILDISLFKFGLVESYNVDQFISTVIDNLYYKRNNINLLIDNIENIKKKYSSDIVGKMYYDIYKDWK